MTAAPAQLEAVTAAARTNLLAYAITCDRNYQPAPFHARLAALVQSCMCERENRRLIISLPPRHGKSRLTTIEAASFLLGIRPETEIVVASYGLNLAIRSSKAVRSRINDNAIYRSLFPGTQIAKGSGKAEEFYTTAGGRYQAVGVGGGLTGGNASVLILDDLLKDRMEADSKTQRQHVWEWYLSTAFTRLAPDGVVLCIGTRWHKDDLPGRLTDPARIAELEEAGSSDENFQLVNYRALSRGEGDPLGRPEGESLWPKRWSAERMRATRAVMSGPSGRYEWNALYEGEPTDRESNAELMRNLRYVDLTDVPSDLEQIRTVDLAVTDKQTSDYNASARGGFHKPSGLFYITNIWRKQSRWHSTRQALNRIADIEGSGRIHMEGVGAFESLVEQFREDRMGKDIVTMFKPTANKMTRATPWMAAVEAGKVVLVRGPWNREFVEELCDFPGSSKNDDQIDCVSALWEKTTKKDLLLFA